MSNWFFYCAILLSYFFIILFYAFQNAVPQKGNEVNLTLGGIDLNNSGRLACFLQLHTIIMFFILIMSKIEVLWSFDLLYLVKFAVSLSNQTRNSWLFNFLMVMMDELSHLRCLVVLIEILLQEMSFFFKNMFRIFICSIVFPNNFFIHGSDHGCFNFFSYFQWFYYSSSVWCICSLAEHIKW